MRRFTRIIFGTVAAALLPASFATTAHAEALPTFIPADVDWLTTVNYFRDMAGLPHVTEDPSLSAGAAKHSCYMLANGISHDEQPGKPGYSPEGDEAGNNGNVAVSSSATATARDHIELWMTGPFHAIGILRANLQTVGFGQCSSPDTTPWRSGATLDILRGLGPDSPPVAPILFPGDGTTTSLSRFITESPDPLPYCGWSGSAGLPVIALMPEPVTAASASITGPRGPVETCALSQSNTDGTAQQLLRDEAGVIAIPRSPLEPGTYEVTVTTSARTVQWHFIVDPAAALGPAPAPQARPVGEPAGFTALTPARVVDTRLGLGGTTIAAGVSKRLQITGAGGVTPGSRAISANFTVVDPSSAGYLTVWNCSSDRPTASMSNFVEDVVTPSAGSIPLDPNGGVCVYSNASVDLVVDVNGTYGSTGDDGFSPVYPARTFDTREAGTRLDDGQTVQLQISGQHQIPVSAHAVVLNITSVEPTANGYVTAYPCDQPRPEASNLNPRPGRALPNMVVTPLAADGSICLYALQDVDLVVDVTGYFSTTSSAWFTATTPFRLTDTRDSRAEMQAGTGGGQAQAGQTLTIPVAGVRGVPADATAISLNLTIAGAVDDGFVSAYPCGTPPPTSTANYERSDAISNGAQLPLSADGTLCVFVQRQADVIIDITGWWS